MIAIRYINTKFTQNVDSKESKLCQNPKNNPKTKKRTRTLLQFEEKLLYLRPRNYV